MTQHGITALLIALTSCALAAGCAPAASVPPPPPAPTPSAAALPEPAEPDTALSPWHPGPNLLLEGLSLRERAGQLIMPWIGGEYWASDRDAMRAAESLITREGVGGFVVGGGGSAYDLARKFGALQRASRVPLLFAADLESGPAMRIRGGTPFPGNMALGATGRESDAYTVGRITALEARAIGINLVFAPVADLNTNPANPIINVRSFGEDPAAVARLVAAFVRGLEENGVAATAKHFPGHGDTQTDSHLALPVVTAGRERLDSVELVPFRAAVRAGASAIMGGHIALPALSGPDAPPATLSPLVLDTMLRAGLGFGGVVVTDALNMGAIVSRYGPGRAAVLSLEAGADLLLMPTDARAAIDSILAAVETGRINASRVDRSARRIVAMKQRARLFERREVPGDSIADVVGLEAHRSLARDITQRSLTLVRDETGLVPVPPERRRRVLVIAYADAANPGVGDAFLAAWSEAQPGPLVRRLWPASGPASYDSVRAAARTATLIILLAATRPVAWQPEAVRIPAALEALVDELSAAGSPLIAVSLGSPYVLAQMPRVPAYLAAWGDNPLIQAALARALLGLAALSGHLPVSLPPAYPVGHGLERAAAVPVRRAPLR